MDTKYQLFMQQFIFEKSNFGVLMRGFMVYKRIVSNNKIVCSIDDDMI